MKSKKKLKRKVEEKRKAERSPPPPPPPLPEKKHGGHRWRTGNEGPGNKRKVKKKHGGHRWRRRRRKVAKKVLAIKGRARGEAWQAKSGKRLQWQPESLDEKWLSREQQRMESKEKAKEKRVACFLLPRKKGSVAMASKEETLTTLEERLKKLEEFSRKLEKREELEETQSRLERSRRLANKLKEGRRDAEAKMKENAKSSRSEDEGSIAMARGLLEEFSRKFEKLKKLEKTPSRLEISRRLANKMKEGRRDAEAKMKEKAKTLRSEDEGRETKTFSDWDLGERRRKERRSERRYEDCEGGFDCPD